MPGVGVVVAWRLRTARRVEGQLLWALRHRGWPDDSVERAECVEALRCLRVGIRGWILDQQQDDAEQLSLTT